MGRLDFILLLFISAAGAGCDKTIQTLDRGRVVVTGLHPPSSAISSGAVVTPPVAQTRQTVRVVLSAALAGDGDTVTLVNTSLPGSPTLIDQAPIGRDAGGGAELSFVAGLEVRAGHLAYGDNHLRIAVVHDGYEAANTDVTLTLRDFEVAGLNFNALAAAANGGAGTGWSGTLLPPAAAAPASAPPETLSSGLFDIVDP